MLVNYGGESAEPSHSFDFDELAEEVWGNSARHFPSVNASRRTQDEEVRCRSVHSDDAAKPQRITQCCLLGTQTADLIGMTEGGKYLRGRL